MKRTNIGLTDEEIKNLISLAKCARRLKPMQRLQIASEAQVMVRRAHRGKSMSKLQKEIEARIKGAGP